jgi:hypothetical protein
MNLKFYFYLIFISCSFGLSDLSASNPGIFGLVDKVVLEPNKNAPESIQIWGTFAIRYGNDGSVARSSAEKGYLYFKLNTENGRAEDTRRDWAHLSKVAGTGIVVGFAPSAPGTLSLRKLEAKPDNPDIYTSIGVYEIINEQHQMYQKKPVTELWSLRDKEKKK